MSVANWSLHFLVKKHLIVIHHVFQQHVRPEETGQDFKVQGSQHRVQSHSGGPHSRLHEPARHDLQHVWTDAQAEVVCLDRGVLLVHQLCKLQKFRGHQTDDEQLHAFHLSGRHVLPPEPTANVSAMVTESQSQKSRK
ncbi:hypothetical protein F7725_006206 [Dissostichus mawsoni]|uniref:Uncharacterized protein n=1 Tax=Dissostichus mawsoni TaxID=36200 RepID=A0A7J5YWF9_DISMA|nr:hypothetical protein F7725_006202 [Dissostichus mawsoni]KAF3852851.1 hypothetical protein F7725_006206 [Dissostichus mawsoni]